MSVSFTADQAEHARRFVQYALNDMAHLCATGGWDDEGSWQEYLNRQLEPDSDFMPLSTPYHVAMAALEVERLLGGPGAFGLAGA